MTTEPSVHAENTPAPVGIGKRGFERYRTNPLLVPSALDLRTKTVKAGVARDLIDPNTGEVHAVAAIYQRKIVDSERFAKVYLDGFSAIFELGTAAKKVFKTILMVCEKDSDKIYLNFMVVEEVGRDGISQATFMRGMRELIQKKFIAESVFPHQYWINPHIFYNGNRSRLLITTEYVNKDAQIDNNPEN